MEFASEGSLRSLLDNGDKITDLYASKLMHGILSGVAYIHD
jgi:serine/threonine protein kinase